MSQEELYQFRFAPGVLEQIQGSQEQQAKAEREGYRFSLGDMDLAQAAIAHNALSEAGIDHTSPAGYVVFKTAEERLEAIEFLQARKPQELGWKWREERDPRPKPQMTTEEWVSWIQTQPVEERYLEGTSKDPNRPEADK